MDAPSLGETPALLSKIKSFQGYPSYPWTLSVNVAARADCLFVRGKVDSRTNCLSNRVPYEKSRLLERIVPLLTLLDATIKLALLGISA